MSEINIPGVSDKYKTNDLVNSLIEVEKLPLNREKEKVETYKSEQENWRRINQHMTSLRESSRVLYSFDNPFNDKITESSDERALTATAGRDASLTTFSIDIENIAKSDRFLSESIEKNTKVPEGKYVYTIGEKTITLNWKGGKLSDFVTALNRRGTNILKSSIIGVTADSQSLLIESLKTGKENRLQFKDAALDFALSSGMIEEIKTTNFTLPQNSNQISKLESMDNILVSTNNEGITVPPENGFKLNLPSTVTNNMQITFTVETKDVPDITITESQQFVDPTLPSPGVMSFKGIVLQNFETDTTLAPAPKFEPREPVQSNNAIYIQLKSGEEIELSPLSSQNKPQEFSFLMSDYQNAESIVIKNKNTGKELFISTINVFDVHSELGYRPLNPVSIADDAKIKFEGITMYRSENKIDDIIPNLTLNLSEPTEKTATIKVLPNTEAAKEALINFVGRYNQLIAEINILTQNKPEIISELEYFTETEQEEAMERLGMFQGDFSLTNVKSALQRITTNPYRNPQDENEITMLAQIGIATKSGSGSSLSSSQLRGYLEIDEKKLDAALENNITSIKNIFGFDSNEDLITDNGIGYLMDENLKSFVQIGGIIATKTRGIESKIKASETTIKRLENQIAAKEMELRRKYGQMESTLNNLESQSSSLSNFGKNNN